VTTTHAILIWLLAANQAVQASTPASATACPDLAAWSANASDEAPEWLLDSAGDSARVADAGFLRFESSLTSPAFQVPHDGFTLAFDQVLELSWANTVAVFELRIGEGEWIDFLAAGGRFVSGGYNVDAFQANPLGARKAWGGLARRLDTRAVIPAQAAGQSIELRFRIGSSGTGDARPGWELNHLHCE